MKYRKGDVVSLTATVLHNFREGDGYLYVDIDGAFSNTNVDPSKVELVSPRIEVGDIVDAGDAYSLWIGATVVAIFDGRAWIHSKGGSDAVRYISELSRIDADPDTAPEVAPNPEAAE